MHCATLIIDSDREFGEKLCADPHAKTLPPRLITDGEEAVRAIRDIKQSYAAIYVNPIFPNPGGLRLISLAHQYHPATPIYVIYNGETPFTARELNRLAVHRDFRKPVSYKELTKPIQGASFKLYDQTANAISVTNSEIVVDQKYVPVSAREFLGGERSFFDVYVRLPSAKYLKILEANDCFTPDRVMSYLQKGVSHFYISKDSHQRCLTYCDLFASLLLINPGISAELKSSHVGNIGDRLVSTLRTEEFKDDHIEYANSFLANVRDLVSTLDLNDSSAVATYLHNATLHEHAVATTMIASLVALPLGIQTEQALKIVGLASMFHDIGLYKMPKVVQDGDLSKMNEVGKELYYSHPLEGAEILRSQNKVDAVVVQAVAEHHERAHGKGFPRNISAGKINKIAEIVGISDEFAKLLLNRRKGSRVEPVEEMNYRVVPLFSESVGLAFDELFSKLSSGQPTILKKLG